MNQLFWVLPGQLAGRCGPDENPWDLTALRQAGIGAVLSVNDGRLCNPSEFARLGIAYACHPLSDWVPPQPGDAEHCLAALPLGFDFVIRHLALKHQVIVHCSGGNDRTGLFMGYFLVRNQGLSPSDAIAFIKRIRATALSADGWTEFALQVLSRVSNGA